jgi:hypothetical protein
LRCRDYAAAFAAFERLYACSLNHPPPDDDVEVAPFQLLHDAECIEDAIHVPSCIAILSNSIITMCLYIYVQNMHFCLFVCLSISLFV